MANQLLVCPHCNNPQLKVWVRWHYRTSTAVFATPQVEDGSVVYFCTEGALSATNREVEGCTISCAGCGKEIEPGDQEWNLVVSNLGDKQSCTIRPDPSSMEAKL